MKHLFHLRGRRWTAALTVLLLGVSQLAVAMHACSPMKETSSTAHHMVEGGRDCDCPTDEADETGAASAICKQHCESGHQNLAKPFVADHISFTAVLAIPGVTLLEPARSIEPPAVERVATSPHFLRNAILRI
jgi:HAMP domain-containing protein